MWEFSPGSRLKGIVGKRPLVVLLFGYVSVPWTQFCTGTHTHACIHTIAANTHTYQQTKY